jgi:uncharacterized protein (DUF1330 family)
MAMTSTPSRIDLNGVVSIVSVLPFTSHLPSCGEVSHSGAHAVSARVDFQVEGAPAPKSIGIVEWDSLDDAVAFYKSKAWTDLAPQRDKAVKVIRRFVVEVEK